MAAILAVLPKTKRLPEYGSLLMQQGELITGL
jgi:hypothetical protein